jgi:hypothetical protein
MIAANERTVHIHLDSRIKSVETVLRIIAKV